MALGTDIAHLLDNLSLTEVDMLEPSIRGSHVRVGREAVERISVEGILLEIPSCVVDAD